MVRKYTNVEQMAAVIMQHHEKGETYREIGTALGLSREEVRGTVKRRRKKSGR